VCHLALFWVDLSPAISSHPVLCWSAASTVPNLPQRFPRGARWKLPLVLHIPTDKQTCGHPFIYIDRFRCMQKNLNHQYIFHLTHLSFFLWKGVSSVNKIFNNLTSIHKGASESWKLLGNYERNIICEDWVKKDKVLEVLFTDWCFPEKKNKRIQTQSILTKEWTFTIEKANTISTSDKNEAR